MEESIPTNFDWAYVTSYGADVLGKLDDVWHEMGLLDEERSLQLRKLQQSVEKVFSAKLTDELTIVEEYKKLSQTLSEQVKYLTFTVLKLQVDDTEIQLPMECSNNLLRTLTWLKDENDRLLHLKEERLGRLQPMSAEITSLSSMLEEALNDEFLSIGEEITENKIVSFEKRLIELRKLKQTRETDVNKLCGDVAELIDELEFQDLTELDAQILKQTKHSSENFVGLTMNTIEKLSERASFLTKEKQTRTERLRELGAEIQPLWDLLEIDDGVRQKFFEDNTGLGLRVIQKCEEELISLISQKKEKLKEIIEKNRVQIRDLWDKLSFSESQKKVLDNMMLSGNFTEELYQKHDDYLKILEKQFEILAPILEKYEKYLRLSEERDSYEALIKDSSRLLDRRRGIAQLREEEQQRKRVTKTLPSIIERIKSEAAEYEKKHEPLLINGVRIEEVIESKETNHKEKKLQEKEEKKRQRQSHSASSTPKSRGTLNGSSRMNSVSRSKLSSNLSSASKTPMSIKKGMAAMRQQRNDENKNRLNF